MKVKHTMLKAVFVRKGDHRSFENAQCLNMREDLVSSSLHVIKSCLPLMSHKG